MCVFVIKSAALSGLFGKPIAHRLWSTFQNDQAIFDVLVKVDPFVLLKIALLAQEHLPAPAIFMVGETTRGSVVILRCKTQITFARLD